MQKMLELNQRHEKDDLVVFDPENTTHPIAPDHPSDGPRADASERSVTGGVAAAVVADDEDEDE
ncbi:unnamed protein product [Echinostoma caproni]|uniref:Uncharacterized protein n=1 Tax=Echinostoma caproni TaxID=27848 RepID=A0A3P8H0C7_9TREM|nr:unnamed protein product [Echinostoma caproni]